MGISAGNTYPVEIRMFKNIGQSYLSPTTGTVLLAVGIAAFSVPGFSAIARGDSMVFPHGALGGSPCEFCCHRSSGRRSCGLSIDMPGIPIPVLILIVVALTGTFVTKNTTYGRYLHAIGGNPEAARLSGINLPLNIMVSFCVLGALAGVAGIIYTARVGAAGPDTRPASVRSRRRSVLAMNPMYRCWRLSRSHARCGSPPGLTPGPCRRGTPSPW